MPAARKPSPVPYVSPLAAAAAPVRVARTLIPPPAPASFDVAAGQTPLPPRASASPSPPLVEPRPGAAASSYQPRGTSAARALSAASAAAVDASLSAPAQRVLDDLVQLDRNERVAIVHDRANDAIASAFELAALERGARIVRVDAEAIAPRPWSRCPPEALEAASSSDATVFVTTNEDGEYDARHAFVTAATGARARHVHIVGTSKRAFIGSLVTNPHRIFDLLTALRGALRPQSRLQVRTPAGTFMEVEMAPHLRWFAMGSPLPRGQWLNVPYGALVSSPLSVTGTYVVDASMGGGLGSRLGSLANRPVRLTLDAGRVKAVECRDAALESYVKKFLGDGMSHDRIGLIRLGANIGIASPLGELLYDEVMPGVHLSLGDPIPARTGAHWNSHGQLPFAIADADVDLDGEALIRHGRYVRLV